MDEKNVLVIEDRKEDALFLEKELLLAGYRVNLASSGEDGVKLINSTSFVAILTELHMPGVNGVEITREALKGNPGIGVIVIATTTDIRSAVEAMEKGAYGYVTKPFNPSEVRIVVERAVERLMLLGSTKKKEQFAELSVKDGLTGAYNRRFLDIFMNRKMSLMKRATDNFSMLMLDIDHFKKYNDTHGHRAGDELLQKMCKVIQEAIREEDILFRYGGEEFTVFLANSNKECARLVAERILTSVNLYMPSTVSIGVSTFPEDGEELATLLSKADAALYTAKESGRNRVCLTE